MRRNDCRTHLPPEGQPGFGATHSVEDTIWTQRRQFAAVLEQGGTMWWFDSDVTGISRIAAYLQVWFSDAIRHHGIRPPVFKAVPGKRVQCCFPLSGPGKRP